MTNILKTLAIGILAAILGHLCAGCDGTGGDGGVGGDPCSDPQVVVVTSATLNGQTADPIAGAQGLCVGWTAGFATGAGTDASRCAYGVAEYGPTTQAVAQSECKVVMTSVECADAAHDFVDSAGVMHGYVVATGGTLAKFEILYSLTPADAHPPVCTSSGVYLVT